VTALLLVLFFLSGASSLVGEVVWMRLLGLVVGNSMWAASAVVTAWMAGLAAGAWLGGRLARRVHHHLRLYAAAEAVVALFYLATPSLLPWLERLAAGLTPDLSGHLLAGLGGRFLLSVGVLLLPTTAMGVTLPLLVERLRGHVLAERVAGLYGVNTLGAVVGVLITAHLLLPRFGESGALASAALACLAVVVAAVLLEGRLPRPTGSAAPARLGPSSGPLRAHLVLVAAMGFGALAVEIVWVRVLTLHLGSRVYAFALMLAVYLLGIGIGSIMVGATSHHTGEPRRFLAWLQAGVAAAILVNLAVLSRFQPLLGWLTEMLHLHRSFANLQVIQFLAVAAAFLPVTMLLGASFPLAVAADPAACSGGEHTGRVAAANTVGAILGAVATPAVLVPVLGTSRSLLLLALLSTLIALALGGRRVAVLVAGTILVIAAVRVTMPRDAILRAALEDEGDSEVVALEESLTATVIVRRYRDARGTWYSLELNGVNVAGTSPSLLAVQQLQGEIPLLEAADPRRVLHIGFGSGGTCWAVSHHPVERVDVVEIAPEVLRVSDHYFADINHHVLADPRVHTIINDGRNYLLATENRYDVILSDSIHPVYAGNSTLYTLEYFRLCREHLEPGGVVSMWLPLYSLSTDGFLHILSAFHEVFPRTVVWYDIGVLNEFTIVTGMTAPGPVGIRWATLAEPGLRASLAIAGIRGPRDLEARLLLDPVRVALTCRDVPPHVDDLPVVEYGSGRLLDRERSWLVNFQMLAARRTRRDPFAAAPAPWSEAAALRDRALKAHLRQLEARIRASR